MGLAESAVWVSPLFVLVAGCADSSAFCTREEAQIPELRFCTTPSLRSHLDEHLARGGQVVLAQQVGESVEAAPRLVLADPAVSEETREASFEVSESFGDGELDAVLVVTSFTGFQYRSNALGHPTCDDDGRSTSARPCRYPGSSSPPDDAGPVLLLLTEDEGWRLERYAPVVDDAARGDVVVPLDTLR